MTLDLTTSDLRGKQGASGNELKKHFKPQWLTSDVEPKRKKPRVQESTHAGGDAGTTAAGAQTPRPDAVDFFYDTQASPNIKDSQGERNARPAKVQILGLHTRNPIISYGGNVYSCQWASNVGTELLFTPHDPNSALPVLRHLAEDVDLLASSSSRIISKPIVLEPKPQKAAASKKRRAVGGKDPSLLIPVGDLASEKRKDQARFLQRMMEIKEERGEDDEVTVYTEKRLTRNQWKAHFANQRKKERAKMENIVRANKNVGGVDKAKARLAELDREEENVKELEARWVMESRVKGTGRTRIKGVGFENLGEMVKMDGSGTGSVDQGAQRGEMLSTPKPQRWGIHGDGFGDVDELSEDNEQDSDADVARDILGDEDDYGDDDADPEDELA